MLEYAINFEDDEGTFLVSCPDLPEVVTFGETRKDAIHYAKGAIEEIICARFALGEDIPAPRATGEAMVRVAFDLEFRIRLKWLLNPISLGQNGYLVKIKQ